MTTRITVPSVVGLDLKGVSPGMTVFLQAVQDALTTLDRTGVSKDQITARNPPVTIRRRTAQGQSFAISSVNVASGDDYAALVQNFEALLNDHLALRQVVIDLIDELRGDR